MSPNTVTLEIDHPHDLADLLIDIELPEAERPRRDQIVRALVLEQPARRIEITVEWVDACWLSDWLTAESMEDRPFLDAPDHEHIRWSRIRDWAKDIATQCMAGPIGVPEVTTLVFNGPHTG